MTAIIDDPEPTNRVVTKDDVERVLAVGRLLLSVLTQEELERLQRSLATGIPLSIDRTQSKREKGNAGVP
jgi:hypothetical protein